MIELFFEEYLAGIRRAGSAAVCSRGRRTRRFLSVDICYSLACEI